MPRPTRLHSELLKTGMGRPLSADSLKTIMSVVVSSLPKEAQLSPRLLPGVTYVPGQEWQNFMMRGAYYGSATEERAADEIRAERDDLVARGILDKNSAESAVELPVKDFSYENRHRTNSRIRVSITLGDATEHYYKEGFLLRGERNAIKDELGIPYVRSRLQYPIHDVSIGLIAVTSSYPLVPARQLLSELPAEVRLEPLDITRLE